MQQHGIGQQRLQVRAHHMQHQRRTVTVGGAPYLRERGVVHRQEIPKRAAGHGGHASRRVRGRGQQQGRERRPGEGGKGLGHGRSGSDGNNSVVPVVRAATGSLDAPMTRGR